MTGEIRCCLNNIPEAAQLLPARHLAARSFSTNIDGDGYTTITCFFIPRRGALTAYLFVPDGGGESQYGDYLFKPIGQIASDSRSRQESIYTARNLHVFLIQRDDYVYLSETRQDKPYTATCTAQPPALMTASRRFRKQTPAASACAPKR
ncbi:hypothetical protein MY8738_000499 [Beauveria namnaoensis]